MTWANIPVITRIHVPPHLAPWYGVIAGLSLTLAILTTGLWLLRSRSVLRISGRVLLLIGAGLGVIAYVAGWLGRNPDYGEVDHPDLAVSLVLYMPCFWTIACGIAIGVGLLYRSVPEAEPVPPKPARRDLSDEPIPTPPNQ